LVYSLGQLKGKGANKLISLSKKGSALFQKLREKTITEDAFSSSETHLRIGVAGRRIHKPLSYEELFRDSRYSKVPGYGKPHTGKFDSTRNTKRVELKRSRT